MQWFNPELENEKSTDTSKKNEPSESSNDSVSSSNDLGKVENIDMSEETSSENLNIPSAVFDAKCLYRLLHTLNLND